MFRAQAIGYLLLLGLLPGLVRAQLAHTERIEILADANETETFDVTPLAERGLLVTIRAGGYFDHTDTRFTFRRYTTALKPLWQTEFKPDVRFRPVLNYADDRYAYHLFREPDSETFLFARLHLDDGVVETFEGNLLHQFDVQHLRVMGSRAYVAGYHHNRPVVMAFSFFDRSVKVLPGLYVNHMEISSLEIDEARQEVNVLVHSLKRHCRFSIRTYSADHKLLRTVDLAGAKNSLISGKLLPLNDEESLLIGNYSTDCTPYSQGIYVTRIRHDYTSPSGETRSGETRSGQAQADGTDIEYIEFSQLQNFFNYLKPKRQQKLMARVNKRKEEGKDYKFRYRLLVHDIQRSPNGLTLVAEVYYPQYRGSTLPYAGMLRGTDRGFEGFHYTHAFVCGFDRQGNLLWDNCLPIKELTSPELTEMVQVSQQGNRMVLAYPNDGAITTEVIQGSKVLKESEKFKLRTNTEAERVTFSAQDNLMAWYGRHFLAFGVQKIASQRSYVTQREVFYLNKLTYDPDAQPAKPAEATTRKNAGSER